MDSGNPVEDASVLASWTLMELWFPPSLHCEELAAALYVVFLT